MLGLVALSEAPISALGGTTTAITLTSPTFSTFVGDGMDTREVTLIPLEVISFTWPDLTIQNFQNHDLEFAQNITMGAFDIDHPARIFQHHGLDTNDVRFGNFDVPTVPYDQDHKFVATHSRGAIEYGNLTFTFTVNFGESITETVQTPVAVSETEQIVAASIWTEQTDSQTSVITVKSGDGITETVQSPVAISEIEQIVTADIWTEQTDSQTPLEGFTEQSAGGNPSGWTTQ
jgi:hypothetical protein